MKNNLILFLICSYILAFAINLIPSLKYPDSTLSIYNFLFTVLLLIVLLIYIKKSSYIGKATKGLKMFLIIGLVSGLIVYIFKMLEDTMMNYFILDIISSIQYPFYLVFITPFFGVNYLLNLNYETFSLLISIVYVIVFILVISIKKIDTQNL